MSMYSYRYQPVFLGGAWWRMDISWRELVTDTYTFADEWNSPYTLPEQPVDEFTPYTISSLSIKVAHDGEIIAIDNVDVTISAHTESDAWLDSDNYEAELRLWWSADGSTWYPIFWGIVDQESVSPEAVAVVEGTWIKTYSLTAYDCIQRLNRTDFNHVLLSSTIGYTLDVSATGTHEVYLGSRWLLTWNTAWVVSPDPPPSAGSEAAQPYDNVIKYIWYLEAPASIAFPEHVHQTPSIAKALYHKTAGPTDIFIAGAFEQETPPLSAAVEATFDLWYIPYPVISSGEFGTDWENVGEVLAELALGIGCAVTTKHHIETGGQWVRQLWYIPRNSVGMQTITPNGVLMSHRGPGVRYEASRVLVSTRTPSGAVPVDDSVAGAGEREVKLNTHLRTIDCLYPTVYTAWPEANGNRIRNVMWQCLLIPGSTSGRLQVANYMRIEGGGVYPFSQYGTWFTRAYNGIAHAIANYFTGVFSSRYRIEEEYSRANATDGTNDHPGVWAPGLLMGDAEDTVNDYRILEVEIEPVDNRVRIVKERI